MKAKRPKTPLIILVIICFITLYIVYTFMFSDFAKLSEKTNDLKSLINRVHNIKSSVGFTYKDAENIPNLFITIDCDSSKIPTDTFEFEKSIFRTIEANRSFNIDSISFNYVTTFQRILNETRYTSVLHVYEMNKLNAKEN